MKLIRIVLGKIILLLDAVFAPKPVIQRAAEAQTVLDAKTKTWTMYQLQACPFCVKVRRQMKRFSIQIPFKDVGSDPQAYQELMEGGKIDQVPCLRLVDQSGAVQWMYESSEINAFLEKL
jgi:glutaredoxin